MKKERKFKMIVKCSRCGSLYEIEDNDPDVILEPYPHIECNYDEKGEYCGEWIPLF